MIEAGGLVKIMDFGLARCRGAAASPRTGTTLGTIAYMSPEQARGEEADHRSDIWSLGAVLYEMIAGRTPFKGDYEQAVLYSIVNEEPEPLTALRSGVPMELERIARKALAKDSAERYQHADELVADLRALTGGPSRPRSASPDGRRGDAARRRRHPRGGGSGRRARRSAARGCSSPSSSRPRRSSPSSSFGPSLRGGHRHGEPPRGRHHLREPDGRPAVRQSQEGHPEPPHHEPRAVEVLQVVTWERLRDLARQAGRQGVDEIDADLGFELCRLEKIDAIVIGSFTKLGDRFVTDIKVLDVGSKASIAVAKADGRGLESIPGPGGRAEPPDLPRGGALRAQDRGNAAPRHRRDHLLDRGVHAGTSRVPTRSVKLYYLEAIQEFTKAVEIDSTFAMAYLFDRKEPFQRLQRSGGRAIVYEGDAHAAKATERERFQINAQYALSVEDDLEAAMRIYRELLEKYPREKYAWTFVGRLYRMQGSHREAIACQERALELDPSFGIALNELAYTHLHMADCEKALEVFQRYSALYPGDANPYDSMGKRTSPWGNSTRLSGCMRRRSR